MAAEFPWNKLERSDQRSPLAGWLAACGGNAAARRCEKTPSSIGVMDDDDVDDDCFLAAILEMEAEERAKRGILGRWPWWEIRTWAILNPERAEEVLGALILAAGIAVYVLWRFLTVAAG